MHAHDISGRVKRREPTRIGRWVRIFAGLCFSIPVALFAVSLHAQGVDSTRTITVPAPEPGIIYLRAGRPGGVHIRSRHRPPANDAAEYPTESGNTVAALRTDDLLRLERLLARQGLDVDVGFARRRDDDVVVLVRRDDAAADTLSLDEAQRLFQSFGGGTDPDEAAPAGIPPLVRRVERSLLDTGLFRSLQINFEFDRSELLPTAAQTLDAVAEVLRRYPDLRIEVAGHADSIGPESYNERLSLRRAREVRQALLARGIERERLGAEGYGEERPIMPNTSPTARALNRRVEFVLLNPDAAEQYRRDVRERMDEEAELIRQAIRDGIRKGLDDATHEND